MIHQGIELLKYGVALGFSISLGAVIFFGVIGIMMLAVVGLIRAKSEADYKKDKK